MALLYGSTLLRQLVTEASGFPPETVHAVLDAYDRTVRQAVENGGKVWVADIGHLVKVKRAPTRKRNPYTGAEILVPAKEVVVLRLPKLKKRLHGKEPVRGS